MAFSAGLITVGIEHFTSLTLQGPHRAGSAQTGGDNDIRAVALCAWRCARGAVCSALREARTQQTPASPNGPGKRWVLIGDFLVTAASPRPSLLRRTLTIPLLPVFPVLSAWFGRVSISSFASLCTRTERPRLFVELWLLIG